MNFWILFAAIAILSGILLDLTVMMIRAAWAKTKPWLHLADEEGGIGDLRRRKLKNGFFTVGKGDNQKLYPITATSRSVTPAGVVYTVGQQSGVNLRPPTRAEIQATLPDTASIEAFETVDPLLLARTFARRMAQETVDSQMEKDDWKKSAILPLSIVAGLAVIALGVIATKLAGS